MELTEINGYSVIGNVATSDGNLILGERYRRATEHDTALEYVVAFVPIGSPEWISGTYFDCEDTRGNRKRAREQFLARVSDSLWS